MKQFKVTITMLEKVVVESNVSSNSLEDLSQEIVEKEFYIIIDGSKESSIAISRDKIVTVQIKSIS